MAEAFLESAQPFGKTFKEECDATRKVIKDISRKLDNFLILFSHKFHISISVECFSNKYFTFLNQLRDEFNNLKKEGFVMDYKFKFEKLKALMPNSQPTLKESYFVLKFIDGLNNVLRPIVKMMCPAIIEQAVERVGLHETALEAITRKHRRQPNNYTENSQQIGGIPRLLRP